jgi:hypothetical protein
MFDFKRSDFGGFPRGFANVCIALESVSKALGTDKGKTLATFSLPSPSELHEEAMTSKCEILAACAPRDAAELGQPKLSACMKGGELGPTNADVLAPSTFTPQTLQPCRRCSSPAESFLCNMSGVDTAASDPSRDPHIAAFVSPRTLLEQNARPMVMRSALDKEQIEGLVRLNV